ncbi:hypothetical protein AWU82_28415 [Pseudomonas glycinae]|uniref:Uncharacterized protein n=1 Tax=Pseudomonas glycinae TaxID=1785145 RepID=A0ABN5FM44_9PSED|nr:hypothetical protein AWU82_28415 [Pseudomonas glycinae]
MGHVEVTALNHFVAAQFVDVHVVIAAVALSPTLAWMSVLELSPLSTELHTTQFHHAELTGALTKTLQRSSVPVTRIGIVGLVARSSVASSVMALHAK